jgi:hypothetical protein
MTDQPPPDFAKLIPELPMWNNGDGIDPKGWVECMGTYELAAGYSLIFWPRFVRFEGYVLRDGFCERAESVEAVMNHVHIADIHVNVKSNEAQVRYLGIILKDIHEVKLRRDFPDLQFVVSFNDEPGLNLIDYQLSFWQTV